MLKYLIIAKIFTRSFIISLIAIVARGGVVGVELGSDVFFLVKSDPECSSLALAKFLQRFPGFDSAWMTEGEYSFVAKFSAPEGAVPLLERRIARNKAILELKCLNAPIRMRGGINR